MRRLIVVRARLLALALVCSFPLLSALGPGVTGMAQPGTQSGAPWYDPAWARRKDVLVTNSSTTPLDNHQIRIDLTSQNFDFSQAQPDGDDFRLTDASGVTLAPLYLQSFDPSGRKATLWTKLSLAAGGSTTLYLYYSNPNANSASDPVAVFDFWDQFRPSVAADSYVRFDLHETTPILTPGPPGAWDETLQEKVQIIEDATEWKLYYSGYTQNTQSTSNIGLATSSDGKNWTRFSGNPVISRPAQDQDPSVLKGPDGRYYMYIERDDVAIDLFVSPNGYDWSQLAPSVRTSAASPVVWYENGTWYMLYERMTATNGIYGTCSSTNPCRINLATSSDGISWTDSPANPVLVENDDTVPDSVAKEGSTYHLYYHRYDGGAWNPWQATSADLTTWGNRQQFLPGYSSPVVLKDKSGLVRLYLWGLNRDGNYYLYYGKDALRTQWTGSPDPDGALQLTSSGLQISGYEIASASYRVSSGIVEARVRIDSVEGSIFARSGNGPGSKFSQGYGFSNGDFGAGNTSWNTALTYLDQPFAGNTTPAPTGQWLIERLTLDGSSLLGERIVESTGSVQASVSGSHSALAEGLIGVKAYSRSRQATLDWMRVRKILPPGVSVVVTDSSGAGTATPTATATPVSPTATAVPTATATPTAAPTVSITNPPDGSAVAAGSTVTITATATAGAGISKVEFSINGALKCTDLSAPYSCGWHVPGKRGATYTIQATAYDGAGNTASTSITVKSQ